MQRNLVQEHRLHDLGDRDRRRDLEHRLLGIDDAALGHAPHLAREAEEDEVLERSLVEPAAEGLQLVGRERERLEELEARLSPADTRNPRVLGRPERRG